MDLVRDVGELARDQDLGRRAEIGAPVDLDILAGEAPISVLAVEQYGDAVDARWESFSELAARGQRHRLGDAVERDLVPCRERLNGGDAGDYLLPAVLATAGRGRLDVAGGAVVKDQVRPD